MAGGKTQMDTGWAWVVLGCSWCANFLYSCLNATAGIFQVEMIEDLGVGSGPISIMTAFALGMASLLGPLSGVLASLLSVRATVFLGVILMSLGMLGASFSHSLPAMIFFYGLITGLGFGIAYSPVIVVISFYFDKHRMLANGIILCAPGMGFLTVPYFIRYIIDTFGWRYAFALNGAIILHILIFASMFFPTDTEKKSMIRWSSVCFWRKKTTEKDKQDVRKNVDENMDQDEAESLEKFMSSEDFKLNGIQSRKYDMILKSGLMVDNNSLKSQSQTLSLKGISVQGGNKPYIPVYVNGTPEVSRVIQPALAGLELSSSLTGESPIKNGSLVISIEDMDTGSAYLHTPYRQRTASELTTHSVASTDTQVSFRPSQRPSGKYKFGQLRKGSTSHSGQSFIGNSLGWAASEMGSVSMLPINIGEITIQEDKQGVWEQTRRICKNKTVWILSVNSLFFISGLGIHAIHFPSYAESKGMSRQQVAQFYTVIGVVMMTGRIIGGVVYNRLKPPLLILMIGLQTSFGIILGLAPVYATSYIGIFLMEAGIGLMYGQSYLILPALIAQIMGVGDLAIAFGIIHLFMGIGYIVSPIFAGFIYDATKTFDIPFYIGGALIVGGALSLILMFFVKREADANKEDNQVGEVKEGKDEDEKMEEEELKEEEEEKAKTSPLIQEHKT